MPTALLIPVLAFAAGLLVFVVDLVLPVRATPGARGTDRRGVGAVAVAALAGVLAATWFVDAGGAPGGAYQQDAFALYVQRLVLAAGALAALGSIDHADARFPDRQGEYFLLLSWSVAGMTLLAGARDLVLLVVAFELMGMPLYALAAIEKKRREGVEAAIKLYLVGAVSSAVALYGLSFVVGSADTTLIPDLLRGAPSPLVRLGIGLALAGMAFKVGAVPFHMWVPDTYQGAPTPFVAFLSVAPKTAGFAALVRLFIEGFGAARFAWWPVLLAVAVATMVVGNLLAAPQTNVKRLLAYSGIGHIGLLLVAFGIATPKGLGVLLFYLAAYLFTSMGAFLVAEAVGRAAGSDELDAWRGLARRSPALALSMLVFLLSLGGIPFVAGFWAKFLLFWAAWEAGMGAVVVLGVVLAIVGIFYYMRVARSIYIEAPVEGAPALAVGRPTAFAIAIALAGTVGLGLVPRPFFDSALEAARSILGG